MFIQRRTLATLAVIVATWTLDAAAQDQPPAAATPTLKALQDSSAFATLRHLVTPAKAAPVAEKCLDFKIQRQEHGLWCWAASAHSVADFYDSTSRWSQCAIASAALKRDCCGAYSDKACDQTGYLSRALTITGNYGASRGCTVDKPCSIFAFATVAGEIDKGHPVAARVEHGRDGHFIVIYGYRREASGNYYYVGDPLLGERMISEDQLRNHYPFEGDAKWTNSYYTRPAGVEPARIVACSGALTVSAESTTPPLQPPGGGGFRPAPVDERAAR